MKDNVRVRFAPSPTGMLHIGGLRTALYNYLFARRHGGACILRIEDTDQTRFVDGAEQDIIDLCAWAGIEFDESTVKGGPFGPYRQSERTTLYASHAEILLQNGTAYYAFDTSEELDAMRERQQKAGIAPKYDRSTMRNQYTLGPDETNRLLAEGAAKVVRLKVPLTGDVKFSDVIRGELVFNCREVDDQILLKSDGFPTYHLANVVDDHLMEISHVIRGEEWLPSTPKHILLYQSFGWKAPTFAHLPLLLNPDKSKMSKRFGDVSTRSFKEKGYLRDALVNFLALLGWNPSSERELFTLSELVEHFDLGKVNKAGAIFDQKKLDWMNSHYLRELSREFVESEGTRIVHRAGFSAQPAYVWEVFCLVRERIHFLHELSTFCPYMFSDVFEREPEYKAKHWNDQSADLLRDLLNVLRDIEPFESSSINSAVLAHLSAKGLALKHIVHPLRYSVTGRSVGAGLFETMSLLGRERCMARILEVVA